MYSDGGKTDRHVDQSKLQKAAVLDEVANESVLDKNKPQVFVLAVKFSHSKIFEGQAQTSLTKGFGPGGNECGSSGPPAYQS